MINIPKTLCEQKIIEIVHTKKPIPIKKELCDDIICKKEPPIILHPIEKDNCPPCPIKEKPLIHQIETKVRRVIKSCFTPGAFEEYILAITTTKTCDQNPICKTMKE